MNQSTQIKIYGKLYNIKSDTFAVNPQEVAKYVDSKMRKLSGGGRSTASDLAILTAINIASELLDHKNKKPEVSREDEKKIDKMISALNRELNNIRS